MSDTPSHIHIPAEPAPAEPSATPVKSDADKVVLAREPSTLDPTRYGDWEKNGRCIDF